MAVRRLLLAALAWAAPAMAALTPSSPGDGEARGPKAAAGVLYATVDRVDLKQYRELFAPAAAIAAVKHGRELPDGTVLTLARFAVQLDLAGKPVNDGNDRVVKDDLIGYFVMRKQRGAWAFASFTADGAVEPEADLAACAACHQRAAADFVFSRDRMLAMD